MIFLKQVYILLLSVWCLLGCSGCSGGNTKSKTAPAAKPTTVSITDNTLDLCILKNDTLNPLKTSAQHTAEVLSLLYDSLYIGKSDFTAKPILAERMTVSDDFLRCSVRMKSNVRFHDGTPLTANDALASVNAALRFNGYFGKRLSFIRFAETEGNVLTLYFKHPVENPSILLDFPILPATEADHWETDGLLSKTFQGSGLYEVLNYHLNQKIELKAVKNHHCDIEPHILRITVHLLPNRETAVSMLENQEIDMLTGAFMEISRFTPQNQPIYSPYRGLTFHFLGVNSKVNTKHFDAITTAVSVMNMTEYFGKYAIPSSTPVHPYAKNKKQEIREQRKSLSTSEYTEHKSLSILVSSDNIQKLQFAKALQGMLRAQSISLKIKALPQKVFENALLYGQYDLYLEETTLLPDFQESAFVDKRNACTNTKTDYIGLCFTDEVLVHNGSVRVEKINTLNPYLSVPLWITKE